MILSKEMERKSSLFLLSTCSFWDMSVCSLSLRLAPSFLLIIIISTLFILNLAFVNRFQEVSETSETENQSLCLSENLGVENLHQILKGFIAIIKSLSEKKKVCQALLGA